MARDASGRFVSKNAAPVEVGSSGRDAKGRFLSKGPKPPGSAGGPPIDLSIEIDIADVTRRLNELEPKVRKKIIRQAMRPAMKMIRQDAIARAPRKTGQLRKSIKVRAFKRSRTKIGVSVTTAKGWFKGEAFYGGFQEWGWKQGKRALGAGRRHIPGHGFMEGAYLSKGPEAKQFALLAIVAAIEEAWKGK